MSNRDIPQREPHHWTVRRLCLFVDAGTSHVKTILKLDQLTRDAYAEGSDDSIGLVFSANIEATIRALRRYLSHINLALSQSPPVADLGLEEQSGYTKLREAATLLDVGVRYALDACLDQVRGEQDRLRGGGRDRERERALSTMEEGIRALAHHSWRLRALRRGTDVRGGNGWKSLMSSYSYPG